MVTVDVDLLVDSCAMLRCGGRGANLILIPSSGPGRNAVGAGGHPLVSKMHGWVTLEFPPPERTAAARALLVLGACGRPSPGHERHVCMVLRPGQPAGKHRPLLLEGPLDERVGSEATVYVVSSHLDALAAADGRYRPDRPVLRSFGDAAAPGRLRYGDILPDIDGGGRRVVVGLRPGPITSRGVFTAMVTTEWEADRSFATDGPEPALLALSEAPLRDGRRLKPPNAAPARPTPSGGVPGKPSPGPRKGRYAFLSVRDAVENLGITNADTIKAMNRCVEGLEAGAFPTGTGEDGARH